MIKQIEDWITDRFGSKRGFRLTSEYTLLGYIGRYQHYHKVPWSQAGRLVFVCTGNICRSAFAEGVARHLGLNAISCGLKALNGMPANPQALKIAQRRGIDLGSHRTQPISDLQLTGDDILIAMEPQQARSIESIAGADHCTLLGLWGSPRLPYIHDPYGAPDTYFDHCFDLIEKSVHEIAAEIKRSRN